MHVISKGKKESDPSSWFSFLHEVQENKAYLVLLLMYTHALKQQLTPHIELLQAHGCQSLVALWI